MHNIHDLERRWFVYKVKSFIPHVLLFLIAIISITLLISILGKKMKPLVIQEIVLNEQMQKPIAKKIISKVEVVPLTTLPPIIIEEVPQEVQTKTQEGKMLLSPSLDFIKNLRSSTNNSYKSKSFQNTAHTTQVRYEEVQEEVKRVQKKVTPAHKTKKILIRRQETQSDINHVIKRFQKNNNPALSLFVAKKYYKLGDYKQAYNYALLTNQINNSIDQSWIIFVKSLVKLGKKDQATKTLKKYIKSSKSANAKILLDSIRSGKFK